MYTSILAGDWGECDFFNTFCVIQSASHFFRLFIAINGYTIILIKHSEEMEMMNDNNDKKRPLTYYYYMLMLVFDSGIQFRNHANVLQPENEEGFLIFLQMVDDLRYR